MSNPYTQIIDLTGASGNAAGNIACTCNAGWTQQAIVTVTDSTPSVVASGTFQGNGEGNQPVPLTSGGTVLSYSGALLPLTLNVQFNYDPNGSFQPILSQNVFPTTLFDNNGIEAIQITVEDYVDNDKNDLILTSITMKH